MSAEMAAIARLLERRDDKRHPEHPLGWGPSPEVAERRRQRLDTGCVDDAVSDAPVDAVARLSRRRSNASEAADPRRGWGARSVPDTPTSAGEPEEGAVASALAVMTRLLNSEEA